ncbi:phage tail spike protein [Amphibacillus cookii]|uniref:phage tail spike protein n=1 Tax=Amphibacillus cookii TaxID=767787 RepID=UPI00195B883A|nr:phage tail spike protein [Amphibacillus cookii]MBM7542353.1 phage minor structural protein [Amphibacillus cookii]
MIHVLNGQTNVILDTIDQGSVLQNEHRRSLKDYLETFEFTALADKKFAEYLTERNRMIIPAEEQGYTEFIIDEVVKTRGPNGLEVRVLALASYLELRKAAVVEPQTLTGYTPTTAVSFATNGTEWRPGRMDSNATATFNIDSYTNPFAFLKRAANEFGLELSFRTETEGGRIVGRYVDLLERVGDWKGREITFGKDLEGIVRKEDVSQVYTALLCLGPENEDGERLETLVENADALQRWGRPDPVTGELKHLVDVFEPQSNQSELTLEQLAQYGRTELDKRIHAFITYECDIVDLENVPDMQNKQIRFGDTIRIKDQKFSPPLYIEARVFEQRRDIFNKSNKHIELGDFIEFTEEEVTNIWRQLQAQINARISFNELQEYTYNKEEIEERDLTAYNNSTSYADTAVENVEIDDSNFKDDTPQIPQNVEAEGFFKVIAVKWSYNNSSTIAAYEVYASQTPGFTPALSNMVWSGKAGSVMFEAETNEMWFFRVRAVNTRGTASGYSVEVSAETVRVRDIDVEMGAINAEKLADLAVTAGKLADGSVIKDKLADNAVDEEKLANDSISAIKIQNGAINNAKLDDLAVTAEKLAEGSVETEKIENYAITSAKIAELAVGTAAIQNGAITNAKIDNLDAEKITSGIIATERIQIGSGVQFDDGYDPTKIEFGGRNLLLNSTFNDGRSNWRQTILTEWSVIPPEDDKPNSHILHVENSVDRATPIRNEKVTKGQGSGTRQYIVSFDFKVDSIPESSHTVVTMRHWDNPDQDGGNGSGSGLTFVDTGTGNITFANINTKYNIQPGVWQHCEFLLNESIGNNYFTFCFYVHGSHGHYKMREIQLEEGNKSTDWSPAPEDHQAYADNAPLKLWGYEDTTYIDGGNIYANTITANEIATGTITAESGIIAELAVGNAAIQSGAITNAKIAKAAITEAKIDDLAVTDAKIASVTADKIDAANLSAISANLGTITAGDITGVNINGSTITQKGEENDIVLNNEGFFVINRDTGIERISIETFFEETDFETIAPSLITFEKGSSHEFAVGTGGPGTGLPDWHVGFSWGSSWAWDNGISEIVGGNTLRIHANDTYFPDGQIHVESGLTLPNAAAGAGRDNGLMFGGYNGNIISIYRNDWVFYGNRTNGSPFHVRSHDSGSSFRSDLWVDQRGYLYSPATWNLTSSNATNVRISFASSSSEARFYRVTSAKKYKTEIELANVDPYKILEIKPKSWYDKGEIERNDNSIDGLKRYYGIIADDFEDVGLPEYVDYIGGEIENIVERAWTLLIPIVKDLKEKVDDLDTKIKKLEAKV